MTGNSLMIEEYYCWGCKACEVACKQENPAPEGVKRITVWEEGPGIQNGEKDGDPGMIFRVKVCRHCDAPSCMEVCPVEAIVKREDGIVVLDETECTGCGTCLDACPYGAIAFDESKQAAVKCNLCHHRVDAGLLPACADNVCLAHCISLACLFS